MAKEGEGKIGTVIQTTAHTFLYIHDPIFIDKLQNFVPKRVDRFLEYDVLGINGLGFKTMVDYWTNDHYKKQWNTIGDAMNLTQVSKHLPFVLNEAISFFDKLKPGMKVNLKDMYRRCFVDILFWITFGENVLENARQFDYVDPFEIWPTVKGNLADLFERLIEDAYSIFFSMPYLIFP